MDNRRYLYHARINKRLTLEQVGVRTALSPTVLRNIDEGRFELLPSGLYARSYIRTFASAVGLDPEGTLAELEHLLPGAPDPMPLLKQKHPAAFKWLANSLAGVQISLKSRLDRAAVWPKNGLNRIAQMPGAISSRVAAWPALTWSGSEPWPSVLSNRVASLQSLAITRAASWHGAVSKGVAPWFDCSVLHRVPPWSVLNQVEPWRMRYSAAVIDALVLLAVDALLLGLISFSSGVAVEVLLESSGWALAAFCAIPIALYFVLFEGVAGTTLGRSVCSLIDPSPDHPLTLPDILRRAVFH